MSGEGWRSRKRRLKGREERTARSHGRLVKAAQTRDGRSGRWRKISRRSSSVRENTMVAVDAREVEVVAAVAAVVVVDGAAAAASS